MTPFTECLKTKCTTEYTTTAAHIIQSVSYTHLDVYKRQPITRGKVCHPTTALYRASTVLIFTFTLNKMKVHLWK